MVAGRKQVEIGRHRRRLDEDNGQRLLFEWGYRPSPLHPGGERDGGEGCIQGVLAADSSLATTVRSLGPNIC
jgi:hypothetical protein